jgi:hypothetical protein
MPKAAQALPKALKRHQLAAGIQHSHRQGQQVFTLPNGQTLVHDGIGQAQVEAGLKGFELLAHRDMS